MSWFVLPVCAWLAPSPVQAAVIEVTTLAEPGAADTECSLSEAVYAADNDDGGSTGCTSGSGDDEIRFGSLTGTIPLASELGISPTTGNITITGPGADRLTIDGGGSHRIFITSAGGVTFTLTGVTLHGGSAGNGGGAVWVDSADVAVIGDCVLTGNTTGGHGGAIFNRGTTRLLRSIVRDNETTGLGRGAGIYNEGTLRVDRSAIVANTSAHEGGGILVANGSAVIVNSTISGNVGTSGGGIYVYNTVAFDPGPEARLVASTVVGNVSVDGVGGSAGGIGVSANQASLGRLALQSSIVAGNTAASGIGADCSSGDGASGTFVSGGHNLVGVDSDCSGELDGPGDQVGAVGNPLDPGLDVLDGAMPTRRPLAGSPAIDALAVADCRDDLGDALATDQRGFARPAEGDGVDPALCDLGAHEIGCGDGVVDDGEACDDGNRDDTDGCTSACMETGGTTPTDSGTTPTDTPTDSGTPTDAGPTDGGDGTGCGCGAAPGLGQGWLLLLGVALALRRRR